MLFLQKILFSPLLRFPKPDPEEECKEEREEARPERKIHSLNLRHQDADHRYSSKVSELVRVKEKLLHNICPSLLPKVYLHHRVGIG
jgi:hypothetical protein